VRSGSFLRLRDPMNFRMIERRSRKGFFVSLFANRSPSLLNLFKLMAIAERALSCSDAV